MPTEEGRVIASGASETKERLRVEEMMGDSLGWLIWLLRKIMDGKGVSQGRAAFIHLEVSKRGYWRQDQGVTPVKFPLPIAPLAASLLGTHKVVSKFVTSFFCTLETRLQVGT